MTHTINRMLLITTTITISSIMPVMGLAKPIPLLENLLLREPWDRSVLFLTKTVEFNQTAAPSGIDAVQISKVTLTYFPSTDCTGTPDGTYTTLDGPNFPIQLGVPFGLVAQAAWNAGVSGAGLGVNIVNVNSIAITLRSTNNNTPQANFSGQSFACATNVTCTAGPAGECTSGTAAQSFTLKTTAAVGDPADGGVIGCQNTGTSFNLFDIVVATSDRSASQGWGGSGTTTGAISTSNGAANTSTIIACLTGPGGTVGCPQNIPVSTYAAGNCSTYAAAGGFTSGWFLPSGGVVNSQLNCLYNNRVAINTGSSNAGGSPFAALAYWSSTEVASTVARFESFNNGLIGNAIKTGNLHVRCVRAF